MPHLECIRNIHRNLTADLKRKAIRKLSLHLSLLGN